MLRIVSVGDCSRLRVCLSPFQLQYALDVSEHEDEVMFQLMQKTTRTQAAEKLTIGFTVIKVMDDSRWTFHNENVEHVMTITKQELC